MHDIAHCPHCGVEMEVPESLRDQEAECPRCEKPFLPMLDEPPANRRSSRREYDDDDDDNYDDDFDDFHRLSPQRQKETAEGRLRPAAIALMIAAILRLILMALILTFSGFNAAVAMPNFGSFIWIMILSLTCLKESLTIFGAWRMLNARSYGWGLAAGILMLIPTFDLGCCGITWLICLGFGIWGIIAVSDRDVRAYIRQRQKNELEMEGLDD